MALSTMVVSIAGVTRSILQGSLTVTQILNGRKTAQFTVVSSTNSFRPGQDLDVLVQDSVSGVYNFGGVIDSALEQAVGSSQVELGVGGESATLTPFVTKVSAVSYDSFAERVFAAEVMTAQSLKACLTTLVTNYLAAMGVTLDPSQVTGPTIPAMTLDDQQVSQTLANLSKQTGMIWEIDYLKVLRMYVPGTKTAPANISSTTKDAMGDVTSVPTRQDYANRVIVKAGGTVVRQYAQQMNGNGTLRRFTLDMPIATGGVIWTADVWRSGVLQQNFPVGTYGINSMPWTYDSTARQLVQDAGQTVLGAADYVILNFQAQYPLRVQSDNATEQAAHGLWSTVVEAPDITTKAQAQALSDGILAMAALTQQQVVFTTTRGDYAAGQTLSIVVAKRNLNATFFITQVAFRNTSENFAAATVTAVQGTTYPGSWRDQFGQLTGGGGGGASTTISGIPLVATTQSLTGWAIAPPSSSTPNTLIPLLDNISGLGGAVNRILQIVLGAIGGIAGGILWKDTSPATDFANLAFTPHPAFPYVSLYVSNGTNVGFPWTAYWQGLVATIRQAGLILLDATEAFSTIVETTKTLTAQRILNLILPDSNTDLNFAASTTWAVAWSCSSGSAPAVGNGTLTALYTRIGKIIHFKINLVAGSTTTFGSGGQWRFSMPSTMAASLEVLAIMRGFNSGSGVTFIFVCQAISTSLILPLSVLNGNALTNVAPNGFNWVTGDTFTIQGWYEEV